MVPRKNIFAVYSSNNEFLSMPNIATLVIEEESRNDELLVPIVVKYKIQYELHVGCC
jgi:hypothetical protein